MSISCVGLTVSAINWSLLTTQSSLPPSLLAFKATSKELTCVVGRRVLEFRGLGEVVISLSFHEVSELSLLKCKAQLAIAARVESLGQCTQAQTRTQTQSFHTRRDVQRHRQTEKGRKGEREREGEGERGGGERGRDRVVD